MNKKENKTIDFKNAPYIWVPWVPVTVATSINGEIVWYKNRWKNLLLKIKFFFIKPRYLIDSENFPNKKINTRYYDKPVNPDFYTKIKINKKYE